MSILLKYQLQPLSLELQVHPVLTIKFRSDQAMRSTDPYFQNVYLYPTLLMTYLGGRLGSETHSVYQELGELPKI